MKKHSHTWVGGRSSEYGTWVAMRSRCYNKKVREYKNYGGRGIIVCDRWKTSFVNFLADMGPRPENHSLDRIDNNGNYEPGNCRWANKLQQCANMRKNIMLTFNGETLCLSEWSRRINIPNECLRQRIVNMGWPVAQALTTPSMKNNMPRNSEGRFRKYKKKESQGGIQ